VFAAWTDTGQPTCVFESGDDTDHTQ
jgi:hypothetical protein